MNELQTLRKTIIEIYRASTDGEENADTQNIFEPMFQVGEFDRKKAENKTPSQITLLNASMRSTQNLFLPTLNSTVTGFSVNLNQNGDSRFNSTGYGSFYFNHSRNYSQPDIRGVNTSTSLLNITHQQDVTNSAGVNYHNMHPIEEHTSSQTSSGSRNPELDVSDLKKSRFHNKQRKLVAKTSKENPPQPIKKPTGLSEFLSMHMTADLPENEDEEKSESKNSFSSSESDQDGNSDEDQSPQSPEENLEEPEPMSYQAQLITSLYHPMPEYPHDRNYYTVNEKMYRMTKDSIYTLIKNLENKETLNYRDGVTPYITIFRYN